MSCTNVTLERMSVEGWIAMPGYYANRDVSKRLNKPHLKGSITSPTQALVKAVVLNGIMTKIDGHSRAMAWELGRLERPSDVNVVLFHVTEEADIHRIYDAETSKLSAATGGETCFTAKKRLGFEPSSKLGNSTFQSALTLLKSSRSESVEEVMMRYRDELRLIDSLNIPFDTKDQKRFLCQTVKAQMLSSFKDSPATAEMFWADYIKPQPESTPVDQFKRAVAEIGSGTNAACVALIVGAFVRQFTVFKATVVTE